MSNNQVVPTIPSGHVLVFRRSTNTNSFGLRGYWTYDPESGIAASCAISDHAQVDVYLGAVISIDSHHIKSAELKHNEGRVKAGDRVAFLAACWGNIRDQTSQEYVNQLAEAQNDPALARSLRNWRKNAAHASLYSMGAQRLKEVLGAQHNNNTH